LKEGGATFNWFIPRMGSQKITRKHGSDGRYVFLGGVPSKIYEGQRFSSGEKNKGCKTTGKP